MSTIVLTSNKPEDIRLLAALAERLGVRFFILPNPADLTEENLTALFDREEESEDELAMLRERLAEFRANPDDYVTLEEFTDTQARSPALRGSRI